MVVTNPKPTTHIPLNNKKLNEFQWNAEAMRVINIDDDGSITNKEKCRNKMAILRLFIL